MTWATFFAAREDLLQFFHFVYAQTDCRVYEAYSRPDSPRREFQDCVSLEAISELGAPGLHLALWSPAVGPIPPVRRIDFKPGAVPGHTHRFVTEGCGLITLLAGGVREQALEASQLGWWTEASALRQALPELLPHKVDWPRYSRLARQLRNQIERRLKAATASRKPVLPRAAEYARQGYTLRDRTQPLVQFTLDAA
jgi:hypothetical protein